MKYYLLQYSREFFMSTSPTQNTSDFIEQAKNLLNQVDLDKLENELHEMQQ